MGEALLICPIKALIRVVGLITHLAAEDLLMYILAHIVSLCVESARAHSYYFSKQVLILAVNSLAANFGC